MKHICALFLLLVFLWPAAETAPVSSKASSANMKFGLDLYRELIAQNPQANTFISPYSVAMCLSMAYNGAGGETARAMAAGLHASGISLSELNNSYADWRAALQKPDTEVQLEIANSLWARRGVSFLPEFLNTNRTFYGAEVSDLDFSDPASSSTINSWVSKKTHKKIDKIVDQIDSDAVLFLINAIYFKGKWKNQFDKSLTKYEPFTSAKGGTVQRPMMHRNGTFSYLENDEFQSVRLPYGSGKVEMDIFLPAKETTLAAFQNHLSSENWQTWISQYEEAEGDLALPRFRIEYETELNQPLKALGMSLAFDQNRADFSRMLQNSAKAFISKVKHKAFAEVNEEGTEAAAATSTEIQIVSMPMPTKRFRMVVDRPFFFVIRDTANGALLFMGAVNNL